jgi:hypothetical protein
MTEEGNKNLRNMDKGSAKAFTVVFGSYNSELERARR